MKEDIDFGRIIENPSELELYKNLSQKLIRFLEINGGNSFEEIIRFLGGSDRRMIRLLDEMVKVGILDFKNKTFFSNNKKDYKIYSHNALCRGCSGKLANQQSVPSDLKRLMEQIHKNRPWPTFIFDQRPVTLETTINRAIYASWRGDLHDKRIAIIGDDDLTSLAIGFLQVAKEIVVFEIDKRLNTFIKKISEQLKGKITPIRVLSQDIFQGVPKEFKHSFDVFMADPTPNIPCFVSFVNAGINLLKSGPGQTAYLSLYPSHTKQTLDFQQEITKRGLLITDSIPFFTEYEVIPETYTSADRKLFKKYAASGVHTGFFENLLRLKSTESTKIKPIEVRAEDFLGEATKRVLKNIGRDPAVGKQSKDRDYLLAEAKRIERGMDKKFKVK